MTRKLLEQVYYINRELKMWERELERLKKRSAVGSPLPRTGTGSGVSDPTANIAERRVETEERIGAMTEQLRTARDEIMKFIGEIPDSLTRMIVYHRCIGLMSWRRVAFEVGGGNTEAGVRMIYVRFLEKIENRAS